MVSRKRLRNGEIINITFLDNKIILGKLPLYEEYKMNNPLFKDFLIRLANYAMLRYELKYDKIN